MVELIEISTSVNEIVVGAGGALQVLEITSNQLEIIEVSSTGAANQIVVSESSPVQVIEVRTDSVAEIIEVPAPGGIELLEVAAQGIPGAAGINGINGENLKYIHVQLVDSIEWIVNHNLGSRPIAEIISTGGMVVEADVLHVSNNQLKVYFEAAFIGSVRCI